MARHGSMAAWLAGGAAAFLLALPVPARACEHHAAGAKAAAVQAKVTPAKGAPAKAVPAVRPGRLLVEKCKCEGPGDCTCAKGKCQCPKCNRRHGARRDAAT